MPVIRPPAALLLSLSHRLRARAGGPLVGLLLALLGLPAAAQAPLPASAPAQGGGSCAQAQWPLWQQFAQRFMQSDGRVVDFSVVQQHSTSEGQSYAMFFALVARDRERFDKLWHWSMLNLAGGDISQRLPAWQWGRKDDGSWGVIDANPASDANLWFAYTLAEAGRIWAEPAYTAQARVLLQGVAAQEVADLPGGLGPTLLPAPQGFQIGPGTWRLNPSYLPIPLARALQRLDPKGPWQAVIASHARLLRETTPKGFAADWIAWEAPAGGGAGRFVIDPQKGDLGSYDAIRTYLWAGMTPRADPLAPLLQQRLAGMAALLQGGAAVPPEQVRVNDGRSEGQGPVGFSAALLPYLQAQGAKNALQVQQQRVLEQLLQAPKEAPARYYDQVLGLFGTGFMEQRYHFLPNGRLQLRWEQACPQKGTKATTTKG